MLTKAPTRDIVLVARDMAFRSASGGAPNPVLDVRAGESVRIVLKNDDRGMVHDFAVPVAGIAMRLLQWSEDASITFTAPDRPGNYEYVCRPHQLMMKGTLRVTQ